MILDNLINRCDGVCLVIVDCNLLVGLFCLLFCIFVNRWYCI